MNYKLLKYQFDSTCQMFSLMVLFGETFFVLFYTWLLAYFDPTKGIIVYIDRFGEAIPELFLWAFLIPYCTYGTYLNFKMMNSNFKVTERRIYKYIRTSINI